MSEAIDKPDIILFYNPKDNEIQYILGDDPKLVYLQGRIKTTLSSSLDIIFRDLLADNSIADANYTKKLEGFIYHMYKAIMHIFKFEVFNTIGITAEHIEIKDNFFNYFENYIRKRVCDLSTSLSTIEEVTNYFNN